MIEFKRHKHATDPIHAPEPEFLEFDLEPGSKLIKTSYSPTGVEIVVEKVNGDQVHLFYDFSDRGKGLQLLG